MTGAEAPIREVYRVKLPGNPMVGEGKPENQNHAIIFTRGEFLQTIDMNQEAYLEEALKCRQLLQEFDSERQQSIVGFREHIFTGGLSSIANFMALQEGSFVTLGQRILAKPLNLRFHYGHPDVFDKLCAILSLSHSLSLSLISLTLTLSLSLSPSLSLAPLPPSPLPRHRTTSPHALDRT
jgi:callose synthase